MKTIELINGITMPQLGFGTFKMQEGEECYNAVLEAIKVGYRHIDTAAVYGNEVSVGKAIKASGVAREEFFITTKLWNTERGEEKVKAALQASLDRLELDYVDLYLVHWPANTAQYSSEEAKKLNAGTWKGMEAIYQSGLAKSIGVSNFLTHHLVDLFETAVVKPMVNQIEFHPGYLQSELVDFCKSNAIVVQAWSPLGQGVVLDHPTLKAIAANHSVSTSAVCIQFALQNEIVAIPKSITPERIASNFKTRLSLSQEEMMQITSMEAVGFTGLNPDTVGF